MPNQKIIFPNSTFYFKILVSPKINGIYSIIEKKITGINFFKIQQKINSCKSPENINVKICAVFLLNFNLFYLPYIKLWVLNKYVYKDIH